ENERLYIDYKKGGLLPPSGVEGGLQYFDKLPETAWNFCIGGYQPAQKWLKDRTGRELFYDEIGHYQRIIVALQKTHELMQVLDEGLLEIT
ncbi:MAG: hypothetical protein RLZZ292_4040, partial [Bacteroidota bacterium]